MSVVQAAVLGAIQGITEFLPISSKSHLIIVPALLGWQSDLSFDVALHWGTALAVILYFRADWVRLFSSLARGTRAGQPWRDPDGRLLVLIVIGSIPVFVAGLAFRSTFETMLAQTPVFAARLSAALLLVTGGVLVTAEQLCRRRDETATLNSGRALAVGIAQAFAILPGISRSGATIAAGLSGGLSREDAARFSFLLGTPAIVGAGVLQTWAGTSDVAGPGEVATVLIGFAVAFVVGYLAIDWLLGYLRRARLYAFAAYTWVFGLATLWWLG